MITKEEARYTPQASNADELCSECEHFAHETFERTARCEKVKGEIQPRGWCKLWTPRKRASVSGVRK